MKKFYAVILLAVLLALLAALAGFAAGGAGAPSDVTLKGVVASATDIDGDGLLDEGGEVEVKLFTGSPVGYVKLEFSAAEYEDMAGDGSKVSVKAGEHAVNAVLSIGYYGDTALLAKDEFSEGDVGEIKKCVAAAWRRNGKRAVILPEGNEVYSTYLSTSVSGKAVLTGGAAGSGFALFYDEANDSAKITYRGVTYTAVKRLFHTDVENPLVVSAGGRVLEPGEIGAHVKSLAEGEMLALFGDFSENEGGEQIFELLDLKVSRAFAPVSEELSPVAGNAEAALSYVLFDSVARASVPSGRVFSTRSSASAGLSLVVAPRVASAGYYANVKLYASAEMAEFEYVRGERITAAESEGDFIRVALEGGGSALLPAASTLEGTEMEAELFYELCGATASVTVRTNSTESSWFSSLCELYAQGGEETSALVGARLTAALGEGGRAVFAEID